LKDLHAYDALSPALRLRSAHSRNHTSLNNDHKERPKPGDKNMERTESKIKAVGKEEE
jgi:hypothetical protein